MGSSGSIGHISVAECDPRSTLNVLAIILPVKGEAFCGVKILF